jgi:hypothetical protein
MRKINVLVALAAAALAAGGVSAKEKSDQPKPRKVCRTEQMPGRITPGRICRVVAPSEPSDDGDRGKPADPREPGKSRG